MATSICPNLITAGTYTVVLITSDTDLAGDNLDSVTFTPYGGTAVGVISDQFQILQTSTCATVRLLFPIAMFDQMGDVFEPPTTGDLTIDLNNNGTPVTLDVPGVQVARPGLGSSQCS